MLDIAVQQNDPLAQQSERRRGKTPLGGAKRTSARQSTSRLPRRG